MFMGYTEDSTPHVVGGAFAVDYSREIVPPPFRYILQISTVDKRKVGRSSSLGCKCVAGLFRLQSPHLELSERSLLVIFLGGSVNLTLEILTCFLFFSFCVEYCFLFRPSTHAISSLLCTVVF